MRRSLDMSVDEGKVVVKQKISLVMVGLLVGAMAMTLMPASAHHSTDQQRLQKQINGLKKSVQLLQAKTVDFDEEGYFYGPVFGTQVVGMCQPGPASWVHPEGVTEFTWVEDCIPRGDAARARTQFRKAQQ